MNPRRLLDPVAEAPGREVGRTPHPGAQGKANFAMQAMLAIGQMYGGARVRVRRYASAGAGVERTRRTRPLGRVTCKEWGPASSLPTPTACCPRRGSFTSRLYRSMHGVAQRPVSSGSIGRLGPDRKPEPWESGAAGPS